MGFSAGLRNHFYVLVRNDPVTNGFEKQFIKRVPGAKNQNHQTIGGGHFSAMDQGGKVVKHLNSIYEKKWLEKYLK